MKFIGRTFFKNLIQDAVMAPMHVLEASAERTGASPRLYHELSRFYHLTRGSMYFGEDLFRKHVRPGGVLLDIGCGPGILAGILQDRFQTTIGLDLDGGMIRRAFKIHGDICFCKGDMRRLPFRNEIASAVVSLGALHCVDYRLLADEVAGVLMPGGEAHFLIEDTIMPLILPRSSFHRLADSFRAAGFARLRDIKVGRLYRYFMCQKPKRV